MEMKTFDALCRQFAERNACLIRPKAKALLERLFSEGESVCVVSASIDNWVRPFFTNMATNSRSNFCVLGTQVEADDNGLLTGRFLTNNCYGAEKVERLCKQYPDLTVHRNDYVIERSATAGAIKSYCRSPTKPTSSRSDRQLGQ